jgi:DNA-directed RNA polymerase specialized sigma24 family protein
MPAVMAIEAPAADERLRTLSVTVLCRRAQEEAGRYHAGEGGDDRCTLEVVRRAVVERDERCWEALHTMFGPLVQTWCRAMYRQADLDVEELAALAWEKFWRSFTADKLTACRGAGSVLAYLRACVHSVTVDAYRRRPAPLPLDAADARPDLSPSPEEAVTAAEERQRLRELVLRHARDERDRAIIVLSYELGLRSAAVQAARPDLFPTVADVYRATRNLLDRLSRSRELRAWFARERA